MTSQFFANIYLHDLDQFVKQRLKMKYYLRYVDDFIILHKNKEVLENCKDKIKKYLKNLKLEFHPDKTKIYSMYKGIDFLGFKTFYYHRMARKRNVKGFEVRLEKLKRTYKNGDITRDKFVASIKGWFAYIMWGDTYRLRKNIIKNINGFLLDNDL